MGSTSAGSSLRLKRKNIQDSIVTTIIKKVTYNWNLKLNPCITGSTRNIITATCPSIFKRPHSRGDA